MSKEIPGACVLLERILRPKQPDLSLLCCANAAVFVSSEFARDETLHPRPGLNERIICSIDSGRPVVVTDAQLRRQNTDGGLTLVVLLTDWRRDILTPEQIAEVKLALAQSGVGVLSGYRLEKMLLEALDAIDIAYSESTGVFRIVGDFAELHPGKPEARALFAIDKTSADSVIGSVASFIFHYTPPIIRFKKGDQQLLCAALERLMDHELAPYLDLKMQTVKKRWAFGHLLAMCSAIAECHSVADIDGRKFAQLRLPLGRIVTAPVVL